MNNYMKKIKMAKNVEAVTHTHILKNKKEEIKNNKNIYSYNGKNCMGRCFCGFKKQTAITLIALIITIIVLLILAGVVLNTVLGDEGIIRKSQVATQETNYKSAKEIVQMKLLEIQTNCVDEGKSYTIKEIATQMKDDEEILIEKYFKEPLASVKDGLEEMPSELTGIVVSVNNYESYRKYKFLIGESGGIKGVLEGEISDTTKEEEFKSIEQFEKESFGEVIVENNEKEEETEKIEITYEKKKLNEDGKTIDILVIVKGNKGLLKVTRPDDVEITPIDDKNKITFDYTVESGIDYEVKAEGVGGTEKTEIINVKYTADIYTIEDLEDIKLNLGLDYELKRDLDFNNRESYRTEDKFNYYNAVDEEGNKINSWEPIGKANGDAFRGSFDGNYHTIKNLYIFSSIYGGGLDNCIGLFGYWLNDDKNSKKIQKLKLDNVNISGGYMTGSVCGWANNYGEKNEIDIEEISVCGNVKGGAYTGGIVGSMSQNKENKIQKCSFIGKVENITPSPIGYGGIVGDFANGKVKDCFVIGDAIGYDKVGGGGILGNSNTGGVKFESCYSLMNVEKGYNLGIKSLQSSEINSYYPDNLKFRTGNNAGGTKVPLEDMFKKATFENWDFDNVWAIEEGATTPYLRWAGKIDAVKKENVEKMPDYTTD